MISTVMPKRLELHLHCNNNNNNNNNARNQSVAGEQKLLRKLRIFQGPWITLKGPAGVKFDPDFFFSINVLI